jgi:hypothetical protein
MNYFSEETIKSEINDAFKGYKTTPKSIFRNINSFITDKESISIVFKKKKLIRFLRELVTYFI